MYIANGVAVMLVFALVLLLASKSIGHHKIFGLIKNRSDSEKLPVPRRRHTQSINRVPKFLIVSGIILFCLYFVFLRFLMVDQYAGKAPCSVDCLDGIAMITKGCTRIPNPKIEVSKYFYIYAFRMNFTYR